jgi:hypothetical protein
VDETKEKYESPAIEPAGGYTVEVGFDAPVKSVRDE